MIISIERGNQEEGRNIKMKYFLLSYFAYISQIDTHLKYQSIKQYYSIMTHRSFYRKVLGDKVKEKKYINNKIVIKNSFFINL